MLLDSLARSAASEGTGTEVGCMRQRVHWRLDLDPSGSPVGPVVRLGEGNHGVMLEIPHRRRAFGVLPLLLDKGNYTLGRPSKAQSEEKAAACRQAWADLICLAAEAVPDPGLKALAAFATHQPRVEVPEDFDPGQFMAVYVSGRLPSDGAALRQWWRDRNAAEETSQAAGQCAVCGEQVPIPETLPVPIRGLGAIGGQAEMSLVSANIDSFEHHGLTRATGARVCRRCGEVSHARLNSLISSNEHRRFYNGLALVWWSSVETPDLMTALFEGGRPQDIAHLLAGPWRGRPGAVVAPDRFDAVILGTSVARVIVRSWISQTLDELADNLARWFADLALVERRSGEARVAGLGLLGESLRPPGARTTAVPDVASALFRVALTGTAVPDLVAQAALRRIGPQGDITHPRASLLRCWLRRRNAMVTEVLDPTSADPAYRAGRLLALLDEASHAATGTSLIERFYAQLSAHPGLVVGRLVDLHQHHLAKLRRDRPAQAGRLQRDVEGVLAGVESFPAHLDLEGRARFALGLYHEQAAQRARRAAYRDPQTQPADSEEQEAEA